MEKLSEYSFDVYWKDERTASVVISSDRKNVIYKRYTDIIPTVPFLFDNPSVEQVYEFLESRCMDRHRTQLEEYLNDLGLSEYNPYEIVRITHGIMWEDFMWLKFPNENINWKEVKLHEKL